MASYVKGRSYRLAAAKIEKGIPDSTEAFQRETAQSGLTSQVTGL
ncbi:hypothetical protein [Vreelandella salicampi]|nr:hypothetical protein [Halomonas salicampi]